ncbi:MAG: hypothetical protein QG588_743 [Candidatus Poribacteria bacterium]|nr:hypothetical protein [Candidatus Poribacteria bacterium]
MPLLNLSNDQVIELVKQLPPEDKQAVLEALIADRDSWWDGMLMRGEQQLRIICAERGLDWDSMNEDEREAFVDDLMHEDSKC